jgi:rod shape determining protein RodA
MIDRRLLQNFDWPLLLLALAITALGIVNLYSATYVGHRGIAGAVYVKQVFWMGIGILGLLAMLIPDYRTLARAAYPIYWVTVGLLVAVLLFGAIVKGSQRWLALGPLMLQPSELAKLVVVVIVARHFHRNKVQGSYLLRDLVWPLALVAIPFLLVLKQPDLGTALLIGLVGGTIFLFLNIRVRSVPS